MKEGSPFPQEEDLKLVMGENSFPFDSKCFFSCFSEASAVAMDPKAAWSLAHRRSDLETYGELPW